MISIGALFNDLAKKEQLTRIGQSVKSQEKVTLKLEISCKTYPTYNALLRGEQRNTDAAAYHLKR
uniref:hypothetical protein n=1 Tax=Vibrio kanaloae TaxID=170673 RepID=UPI001482D6C0